MSRKEISFWIEEGYALYSSRPVIEKYFKKNYKIWIYTNENIEKLVAQYYSHIDIEIILINKKINIFLKILSYLFTILLIDRNFSLMYCNDLKKHKSLLYNFINKIFLFKIKKENINNSYFNFMKIFNKFRFKGDFVIAFTFIHVPYLFANDKTKVILIMESWDHVMKRPLLIKANYFLTWNKDLANDAKSYQNYKHIGYIYPLKLRYTSKYDGMSPDIILESITNNCYLKDLKNIMNKNVILYPVSHTSIDNKNIHLDQLKFIKSLIPLLTDNNYILFIKPKPTGPVGDYDCLLNEKNIIVGEYSPDTDKADMLIDEFQAYRYLLLKHSKLVINVSTTFGLDAAMADVPVMQLNISEKDFGSFAKLKENPHIEKYLLNSNLISNYSVQEKITISDEVILKSMKYSQSLKKWCLNNTVI